MQTCLQNESPERGPHALGTGKRVVPWPGEKTAQRSGGHVADEPGRPGARETRA